MRLDTTVDAYVALLVVTSVISKARAEKLVGSVFGLNMVINNNPPASLLTVPVLETSQRAIDVITDYFGITRDAIGIYKDEVFIGYRGKVARDSVLLG